jgi:hypothetical protein
VIHTVTGSDFIILVTEPTPFGLHDLKIAVEALSPLEIPLGVILNRSDVGDLEVQQFCRQSDIPVLAEIPHSRKIAEGYAKGNLLVLEEPYIKTSELFMIEIVPGIPPSKEGAHEGVGYNLRDLDCVFRISGQRGGAADYVWAADPTFWHIRRSSIGRLRGRVGCHRPPKVNAHMFGSADSGPFPRALSSLSCRAGRLFYVCPEEASLWKRV